MKFSLNGALTIGTLDGANVEMREEVGAENFFLFGLTAQQVTERKASGYNPYEVYQADETLSRSSIRFAGTFSNGEPNLFKPMIVHCCSTMNTWSLPITLLYRLSGSQ